MTLKFFNGKIRINIVFVALLLAAIIFVETNGLLSLSIVILVHELSHGLIAHILGHRILYFEVLPFGCAAKIAGLSNIEYSKEIIVAAAGPASNMIFAALCLLYQHNSGDTSGLCSALYQANIMIASVNLLPSVPLDGGRIFRAILASKIGFRRATQITGWLGIILGILLTFGATYWVITGSANPTGGFMGIFMVYSAIKEMKSARFESARIFSCKKNRFASRDVMDVKVYATDSTRPIGEVVANFDHKKYNLACVLDQNMKMVDVIDESEVMNAMIQKGARQKIGMIKAQRR